MIEFAKIKVSFPVVKIPSYLALGGYFEQGYVMLRSEEIYDSSPVFQQIHKLLILSDPIGRVGNYKAVFELNIGVEFYTPSSGSDPGPGEIGVEEGMRTIFMTIPCDLSLLTFEEIEMFIEKLANIHPWEHPIIELLINGKHLFFKGPKNKKAFGGGAELF